MINCWCICMKLYLKGLKLSSQLERILTRVLFSFFPFFFFFNSTCPLVYIYIIPFVQASKAGTGSFHHGVDCLVVSSPAHAYPSPVAVNPAAFTIRKLSSAVFDPFPISREHQQSCPSSPVFLKKLLPNAPSVHLE